jgi:hypothetical protein
MVSARKIACHEPDPNVTTQSPVVWPWAGTRRAPEIAGNQLNLPLDNVDKVGVREQRQNSMCRVRNPGT